MRGQLQPTLLGETTVRQGGELVTGFCSSKARALLFYLAVTGPSHSRAALVGLLWADMPADRVWTLSLHRLSDLIDEQDQAAADTIGELLTRGAIRPSSDISVIE
jgi:DNA-binding SARP family transcriptional activator